MVCSCAVLSKCVFLLMRNIVTTLSGEKWRIASFSCQSAISIWKRQTWWSNEKAIIGLDYCKKSWLVSVWQINFYPAQPSASANNRSARQWQITPFYSTLSNNCHLFNTFIRGSTKLLALRETVDFQFLETLSVVEKHANNNFRITTRILVHSLANFYCQ